MTTLARRDDEELARGVTAWCARQWPDAAYELVQLDRPKAGWTNETLLVTLRPRVPAASGAHPELSDIRIVQDRRDLTAQIPAFVITFLEGVWSG